MRQFLAELPSGSGVVRKLRDINLANPFYWEWFDHLEDFRAEWDNAEHEFNDQELERMRSQLIEQIPEFLSYLARNTWHIDTPTTGRASVPPEWEDEQLDRLLAVLDQLHGYTTRIVDLHQGIIRRGRERFGNVAPQRRGSEHHGYES